MKHPRIPELTITDPDRASGSFKDGLVTEMCKKNLKVEFEVKTPIIPNDLQDVESLQTAIEVIVRGKDTQGSLAQLYPVLDASPFTPSLVRLMMITFVIVTDMWHAGSPGGHTAPGTVPLHPRRPSHPSGIRKGECQRDLDRPPRDVGSSNSSRRR